MMGIRTLFFIFLVGTFIVNSPSRAYDISILMSNLTTLITFNYTDSSLYKIEALSIYMKPDDYLAWAISHDHKMGDDIAIVCTTGQQPKVMKIPPVDTTSGKKTAPVDAKLKPGQEVKGVATTYDATNGTMNCSFTFPRVIALDDNSLSFNLRNGSEGEEWVLLLAYGETSGGSLQKHRETYSSSFNEREPTSTMMALPTPGLSAAIVNSPPTNFLLLLILTVTLTFAIAGTVKYHGHSPQSESTLQRLNLRKKT